MDASFWALVSLIIFVILLIALKVPSFITGFLDERSIRIQKDLNEAKRLKEEAEALLLSYKAEDAKARKESADLIAHAKKEAERIINEAEVEMANYLVRGKELVEQRMGYAENEVRKELQDLVVKLSSEVAENVLSTEVDLQTQKDLLKGSFTELKKLVS